MNNGWIAVDLDGTLAEYHGWVNTFHIGEPIPLMLQRVKDWLVLNVDVRIFTARVDGGEVGAAMGIDEDIVQRYRDVQAITSMIQDWTEKHLGKRLPVTCKKDYGMVQLWDDRAVQVIPNTGIALQERVAELENRIKELENPKRLGPRSETKEEKAAQDKAVEDFIENAKKAFKDIEGVRLVDHPARHVFVSDSTGTKP